MLKKARTRRYPALTMTVADYVDDLALLANTLAQAESLVHRMEQAAGTIGLHVNTNKTEYMWFNQKGAMAVHIPWQQFFIDWKWC